MRHDESYLLDMLVAVRKAVRFSSGLTYERFAQNDEAYVRDVLGDCGMRGEFRA